MIMTVENMTVENWIPGHIYAPGDLALWGGEVYQKSGDSDQSHPDDIAGGWERFNSISPVQYEAIAASFSDYEERKAKRQAEVRKKLAAAGLDEADVKAVLNA